MAGRAPITRAVILAAGFGSRLDDGRPVPKPLREVAGVPLIVRIIEALAREGVREIGVIIGYLGEALEAGLRAHSFDAALTFIENDEYQKPNGTSLLKARSFITEPTLVLMSDHLWSPGVLSAVASHPVTERESVLGVDYRIDACFDLDDATKVVVDDERIVEIGKTLEHYNAIDTGMFLVTDALLDALDSVNGAEGCSLSQGVATLAADGRMKAADVGVSTWIDVDTPEAHAEAERLLDQLGDDLSGGGAKGSGPVFGP